MILAPLAKIGLHMLLSLLTEKVIKGSVVIALEKVAHKTKSDVDDKLLELVKDAWK